MDKRARIAGVSLSTMLLVAAAVPLVTVFMTINAPSVVAWTDTGGGDHGGSDWIITTNTTIADNHYNIGLFKIAAGVTVTVNAWDNTDGGLSNKSRVKQKFSSARGPRPACKCAGYGKQP